MKFPISFWQKSMPFQRPIIPTVSKKLPPWLICGRKKSTDLSKKLDNVSRFRQMDVLDKEVTKPAYDYDIEKKVEGIKKNVQCLLGQVSG